MTFHVVLAAALVLAVNTATSEGELGQRAPAVTGTALSFLSAPSSARCPGHRRGLLYYRDATWRWQDARGVPRARYGGAHLSPSCRYVVGYAIPLWRERAARERRRLEEFRRLVSSPVGAIRYVFGPYAAQAIRVASCETGGTFWVGARNGQYLGLFQMGSWERRTYGHGPTALEQARAAYRYFRASGYRWHRWTCKP